MQGKYSFWIRLIACLVAALAITSFLIPSGAGEEDWSPLMGVAGMVVNILIALSLFTVSSRTANNVFSSGFSVAFLLMLMLLDPAASYFSCIHPAVLLFIWGQYCFITGRKFASMFLISCSALCYAPLVWILPAVLIISVIGAADMLRVAIKSLGGILLPGLYLLVFRYMAYSDARDYVDEYIYRATAFSSPLHSANVVSSFLVICIGVVALHSVLYMARRFHSSNIITEHIMRMQFLSLALGGAVYFIFGGNRELPVNMIVALPVAVLYSNYFSKNITAATAKGELVILCCAAALARLYYFI